MYREEVQEEVAPALVVMMTEEKIEAVVVMLSKNN
jgi:hypothetical protein